MRTLVDIPDEQLHDLAAICQQRKASRAELIRQAIRAYIAENKSSHKMGGFGIWKDQAVEGLEYQEKMRAEWDR